MGIRILLRRWVRRIRRQQRLARLRQAYVYAAAQVVRSSRQTIVRLSAAHRWYESLVAAHVWLQT